MAAFSGAAVVASEKAALDAHVKEMGYSNLFRSIRRRFYRRNRFKTWYRKASYYQRKKDKIDDYIKAFRSPEQLADKRYVRSLRRDMICSLFKYGSYFNEYFLFGFEGRDSEYRSSFITEGIRMSFYPRMNSPKNTNMLENKYLTYKKFRDMFKREIICIRSRDEITEDAVQVLRDFTLRHPHYIVKPVYAAFGKGVHLDSICNYASLEEAYESYHESGVVIEELIVQGDGMAALHPPSVNTLRIPTAVIKGEDGGAEVRLFNPTVRIGMGGSIIDNFSAGGISALIDPDTGRIFTDGADKKGRHYELHPDTGVRFKGFQIPRWDEAVAMVKEAALMVPGNHYCGWDLAFTKDRGWCMVEANCTAQMGGMQLVTRTGRRQELENLISKM